MKSILKAILARSALGTWLGRIPFLRNIYAKAVWSRHMSAFLGVHRDHESAENFAKHIKQLGWNDQTLAKHVVGDEESELIQISQYAVMLWLSKLLQSDSNILDYGGAGGIFYESCLRYDLLAPTVRWHVVDVPAMVELGRERHKERLSPPISFGSGLADAPPSDIMLMLGMIQYLPDPLGERGLGVLEQLAALPRHIFVNKIPLIDSPDVWTVQGHVTSAVPYRLFNRQNLYRYFEKHGYRLRDRWLVPELDIYIPFNPESSLSYLEGLYFERIITP